MVELSQVCDGLVGVACLYSAKNLSRQATLYKSFTKDCVSGDLAVALALIYILQSVYVIVKPFLKIIGTFCNKTFNW
ncbi:MAG: hypothetical protein FWD97_06535 [Defluviitaleaceae bacterium]|nr:hypothetical protein [Defluviitaleaceae bacterium]